MKLLLTWPIAEFKFVTLPDRNLRRKGNGYGSGLRKVVGTYGLIGWALDIGRFRLWIYPTHIRCPECRGSGFDPEQPTFNCLTCGGYSWIARRDGAPQP